MPAISLQYPHHIGEGIYKSYVKFTIFDRFNSKNSTHYGNILLYMPEQVAQPSTVSWDSAPLGLVGDTMVNGGDAQRALDMVKKTMTGAFYSLASKGASQVGGNITAEDLQGAMANKVSNPYLAILFKGIDFRTFQFSFKFVPHSEEECKTIYAIIQEFRKAALPEKLDNGSYLGYPRELEVCYMHNGQANKWLHKFKRCIIKEIDINYTGSGQWTVLRNGFPAETVLNMTFTEREIVTRNDVGLDGNSDSSVTDSINHGY